MKSRCFGFCLLAMLIAPGLHGQSFNIDIGPDGSIAPPDTYAGAGVAGHWISIPATQGVTVANLVDIQGDTTGASLFQIGGTETLLIADPDLDGDDATLMNDCLITHSGIENCIFMSNLEPGMYEVIVYARMPAQPKIEAVTNVDQEAGNPHLLVGGAWTGQHEEFVTYSSHIAEVTTGSLGLHSGVPAGGDFGIGAALNGFQVRLLSDTPGDVNGDGAVDAVDLLALLAAWGECPDPPAMCAADGDGSGTVDLVDLLELLANWTG